MQLQIKYQYNEYSKFKSVLIEFNLNMNQLNSNEILFS